MRDMTFANAVGFPINRVEKIGYIRSTVSYTHLNGVMTPATVRLKEDGRYELVSGHRRKKACELAGLETLKCEVKELTRDEAIIVTVSYTHLDVYKRQA